MTVEELLHELSAMCRHYPHMKLAELAFHVQPGREHWGSDAGLDVPIYRGSFDQGDNMYRLYAEEE